MGSEVFYGPSRIYMGTDRGNMRIVSPEILFQVSGKKIDLVEKDERR